MERKLVGVIFISLIEVLTGIALLWISSLASLTIYKFLYVLHKYPKLLLVATVEAVVGIFLIVLGIVTFARKPIARKLNLIFSPVIVFGFYLALTYLLFTVNADIINKILYFGIKNILLRFILMAVYILIISWYFIYYFTHPRVKEQFSPAPVEEGSVNEP